MSEPDRPSVTLKERRVALLRGHITPGINLIKQGEGLAAYRHFQQEPTDKALLEMRLGTIFRINSLLSEDDLVEAASALGRTASISPTGFFGQIGEWYIGSPMSDEKLEDRPNLFKPELVKKFYQEAGLVGAEEWLHLLQRATASTLAGQEDTEVDVAAYFTAQGIHLSLDFITRYPERAQWFISLHPDRENEVTAFQNRYHRRK